MVQAIRYRVGIDENTLGILIGWPHLRQSLKKIWTTRLGERWMLPEFGSNIRDHLAEDITPSLALDIYDDLITAAHANEPEFRVQSLRFVLIKESGALGLAYGGVYFPEGRYGNYEIAEIKEGTPIALRRAEQARATS